MTSHILLYKTDKNQEQTMMPSGTYAFGSAYMMNVDDSRNLPLSPAQNKKSEYRPSQAKRCAFLELPGEIRNRIYGYVYHSRKMINIRAKSPTFDEHPLSTRFKHIEAVQKAQQILVIKPSKPFCGTETLQYSKKPGTKPSSYEGVKWQTSLSALVVTCQKTAEEAAGFMYGISDFFFEDATRLEAFVNTTQPRNLICVTNLRLFIKAYGMPWTVESAQWETKHISCWTRTLTKVATSMPNIRSLDIDLYLPNVHGCVTRAFFTRPSALVQSWKQRAGPLLMIQPLSAVKHLQKVKVHTSSQALVLSRDRKLVAEVYGPQFEVQGIYRPTAHQQESVFQHNKLHTESLHTALDMALKKTIKGVDTDTAFAEVIVAAKEWRDFQNDPVANSLNAPIPLPLPIPAHVQTAPPAFAVQNSQFLNPPSGPGYHGYSIYNPPPGGFIFGSTGVSIPVNISAAGIPLYVPLPPVSVPTPAPATVPGAITSQNSSNTTSKKPVKKKPNSQHRKNVKAGDKCLEGEQAHGKTNRATKAMSKTKNVQKGVIDGPMSHRTTVSVPTSNKNNDSPGPCKERTWSKASGKSKAFQSPINGTPVHSISVHSSPPGSSRSGPVIDNKTVASNLHLRSVRKQVFDHNKRAHHSSADSLTTPRLGDLENSNGEKGRSVRRGGCRGGGRGGGRGGSRGKSGGEAGSQIPDAHITAIGKNGSTEHNDPKTVSHGNRGKSEGRGRDGNGGRGRNFNVTLKKDTGTEVAHDVQGVSTTATSN